MQHNISVYSDDRLASTCSRATHHGPRTRSSTRAAARGRVVLLPLRRPPEHERDRRRRVGPHRPEGPWEHASVKRLAPVLFVSLVACSAGGCPRAPRCKRSGGRCRRSRRRPCRAGGSNPPTTRGGSSSSTSGPPGAGPASASSRSWPPPTPRKGPGEPSSSASTSATTRRRRSAGSGARRGVPERVGPLGQPRVPVRRPLPADDDHRGRAGAAPVPSHWRTGRRRLSPNCWPRLGSRRMFVTWGGVTDVVDSSGCQLA